MARSRGRPKKDEDKSRTGYLDVRLEPAEKQAFQAAAELAGLSMSSWVRERLRQMARKELEAAGLPVAFVVRRQRQTETS